jgi:toxin ParE1/3/4
VRLAWRRRAINDLINLKEFIARDKPGAAQSVAAAIGAAAESLADHPHLGRAGRVPETRELPVPRTPYIIAYTVSEACVTILAVVHGARQWLEKL